MPGGAQCLLAKIVNGTVLIVYRTQEPATLDDFLAGHRDLTTTQRYMHLSPAALDSAIRLLDAPGIAAGRGDMLETGKGEPRTRLARMN
jgi:hypothetical protein